MPLFHSPSELRKRAGNTSQETMKVASEESQSQEEEDCENSRGKPSSPPPPSCSSVWLLFVGLILFRVVNGLLVVTYSSPDEWWQGPEVAYSWVFDRGQYTWEWRPANRLRSWVHPCVFAGLFWVLRVCGLDSGWVVAWGPRVMQSCLAGVSDFFIVRTCQKVGGRDCVWIAIALQLFSWFLFTHSVRTFSNSLELVGASVVVWLHVRGFALWVVAGFASVVVSVRPTAALVWGPFLLCKATGFVRKGSFGPVVKALAAGLIPQCLVVALDSYMYGQFTVALWNFLQFNFVQGQSAFFGVHPGWWYAVVGVPYVCLGYLLLVIVGLVSLYLGPQKAGIVGQIPINVGLLLQPLLVGYGVLLAFLSLAPHKEIRFLLPLTPLLTCLSVLGFSVGRRLLRGLKWLGMLLMIGFFVPHVCLCIFIGRVHQQAPLRVMTRLRQELPVWSSPSQPHRVVFLTPCHATPAYSHVHARKVQLRWLDCSPPGPLTERDIFYADPLPVLHSIWDENPGLGVGKVWVVVWSALRLKRPVVNDFLDNKKCTLVFREYDSSFNEGFGGEEDSDVYFEAFACD